METIIRRLEIQTLEALIQVFGMAADSLAESFNDAISSEHRAAIIREWKKATQSRHAALRLLELAENEA